MKLHTTYQVYPGVQLQHRRHGQSPCPPGMALPLTLIDIEHRGRRAGGGRTDSNHQTQSVNHKRKLFETIIKLS